MELLRRPRRLRITQGIRSLVQETRVNLSDLVMPYFIFHGEGIKREIPALPGQFHYTVDQLLLECQELKALGIQTIVLFGLPSHKDALGSEAYDQEGIVQQAVRAVKAHYPEFTVITDVCLCQYTDHGHCGIVHGHGVDNDQSLELLAKTALSHAQAGADMVAPSDMMDGRVLRIRQVLDENGYQHTGIMSYSVKYASAFYGPFRSAAGSTPQFGDRRAYQMDPANSREALMEAALDVAEGADILMVKPAVHYLDVIKALKDNFSLPVAAYHVSGEYAMLKLAAREGLLEEERAMVETLVGLKRAGADILITYFAKEMAQWLRRNPQ